MAATLCGYASIDEKGKAAGGYAGDQTGKEVKIGGWYKFGQTVVLRFKDREKAKKAAKIMKALCENSNVGYDQSQRTTLFTQLKKVNWDPAKLTVKCECDCSSLIAVILNAVGIKVSKDIYTGNMVKAIMDTGEFEALADSKYLTTSVNLMMGDISVKAYSHTIMAIEDGSKVVIDEPKKEEEKKEETTVKVESAKSKDTKFSKKFKTTAALRLRAGAGTDKEILAVMPKGSEVRCYGYYTKVGDTYWLYVVYKNFTGFTSKNYLE